jgi:hypothetical protein
MISCLIIDGQFNLISLLNIELMKLVGPLVVSGGPCPTLGDIFNFHDDESFRSSTETASRGMVHVSHCVDAQGKSTAQRTPRARHVETIICKGISQGRV